MIVLAKPNSVSSNTVKVKERLEYYWMCKKCDSSNEILVLGFDKPNEMVNSVVSCMYCGESYVISEVVPHESLIWRR